MGEDYSEQMERNMFSWDLTPSVDHHIGDKISKGGSVGGWENRRPRLRLWSISFEHEGNILNFVKV
jgi:hypothetical protein